MRESSDRYLSPEQAKRFYDRLGSGQDWQRFYENPATSQLIAHAGFDSAHSVFEFGCGTGALATQVYCSTVCPLTPATSGSTSAAKWFRLHWSV